MVVKCDLNEWHWWSEWLSGLSVREEKNAKWGVRVCEGARKRGARVKNWGKVKWAKFCAKKPTSELTFLQTPHLGTL